MFNQSGDVIEELLVIVLYLVPRRRLLSLCYVCRAWRIVAQRILWEDVDFGFLKLLSPTVSAQDLSSCIVSSSFLFFDFFCPLYIGRAVAFTSHITNL